MIKAEDFKWLDRVYHLFHLGSYLCLSGALTDCFLPLDLFFIYDVECAFLARHIRRSEVLAWDINSHLTQAVT